MKKIFLMLIVLAGVSLVWVKSAKSKDETPPGLEKKPPLEKQVFIHYRKGSGKGLGILKKPKPVGCYGFLAKGAMWKKLPVKYVIDPDNPNGLNQGFITQAISAAAEEWDKYTRVELMDGSSIDENASWDSDAPDGRNEFVWENYPEQDVIAITTVWGYFSVPQWWREIVEFDVMFDTDYVWGNAAGNSALMDLQNIATHEIGHGVGLADQYDASCGEVTMFGYSTEGEITKRDLAQPDITGLRQLYGN